MKKPLVTFAVCVLLLAAATDAAGWGRRNHAAIAYIAEQYLNPTAKQKIGEILGGESMAYYATWADDHRKSMLLQLERSETLKLNGQPIAKGPDGMPVSYGTSFSVDEDGNVWTTIAHGWLADTSYGVVDIPKCECIWMLEKCIDEMRSYKSLSREAQFRDMILIIHMVGDMHCPVHVHFTDARDGNDGKYNVLYKGREVLYHSIWDTDILVDRFPGGMVDFAYYCDPLINGMVPQDEARKRFDDIQGGNIRSWASETAKRISFIYDVKAGDSVEGVMIDDFSALGKDLILRSGYRLAKVLNDLFPDIAAIKKARIGPQLTPAAQQDPDRINAPSGAIQQR